jgi:ATP synthase subunit 6
LKSPLEQFEIIPFFYLPFGVFDFSMTNSTFFGWVVFFVLLFLFFMIFESAQLIPQSWQIILENLFETAVNLVFDNIGEKGRKYVSLIFVLFSFLFTSNLIGMVPYSFTITSHLILTFTLAFFLFLGINIISVKKHKLNFFSLFLPSGSTIILAIILVPIEIVSYFFRVISLPVRLFANMMAGHTLLKVIAGFAWTMMSAGGILFIAHYIPILLLIILIGLELGVAIIQAYVFAILTCMYLNDAINLH